jgi:hypothetical protein
MMSLRYDLLATVESINHFSKDYDAIIWEYNSRGVYAVQSLYTIISIRRIMLVYTPAIEKFVYPLGYSFFCGC